MSQQNSLSNPINLNFFLFKGTVVINKESIHTHTDQKTHRHKHTHTDTNTHTHTHTNTDTHTQTNTHTQTHTHTHTHTHRVQVLKYKLHKLHPLTFFSITASDQQS